MNIIEDLEFRGYISQSSDPEGLKQRLSAGSVTLYAGFDPTADSLHVGSLIPILGLRRFQMAGHKPIALVGGGTGLIGDPSGRISERSLNPREVVDGWVERQKRQLEQFLDFDSIGNAASVVNNHIWLSGLGMIEFLRDIGKHFPLGYMLAKESVASRLEAGISFAEFSYMAFQAYDFLELFSRFDCELQIGGSDQWGNITAGIELIRRKLGRQAYGLTFPLLEKADGSKFGKTASDNLWLDPEKSSPYQFYQFWINTDDRDVVKFLKTFTFLSRAEILDLEAEVRNRPEKRTAQRVLAENVTGLVHGAEAETRAEHISQSLFYGDLGKLSAEEIEEGFRDVPSFALQARERVGLIDLLVTAGVSASKRQAREDIGSGAITVNGQRCTDLRRQFPLSDRLSGAYLVVRRGKQKYHLIRWDV